MSETIFTVIGLIIGAMILSTGLYYLLKAKDDAESRKIYGLFINGCSPYSITKMLTADGVPTPSGKEKWHSSCVNSPACQGFGFPGQTGVCLDEKSRM